MSLWVAVISPSPPHPKVSEQQDNPFGEKGLMSHVVINSYAEMEWKVMRQTIHTGIQMYQGTFLRNTTKCVGSAIYNLVSMWTSECILFRSGRSSCFSQGNRREVIMDGLKSYSFLEAVRGPAPSNPDSQYRRNMRQRFPAPLTFFVSESLGRQSGLLHTWNSKFCGKFCIFIFGRCLL